MMHIKCGIIWSSWKILFATIMTNTEFALWTVVTKTIKSITKENYFVIILKILNKLKHTKSNIEASISFDK